MLVRSSDLSRFILFHSFLFFLTGNQSILEEISLSTDNTFNSMLIPSLLLPRQWMDRDYNQIVAARIFDPFVIGKLMNE